jgi:photosystem II stability/assembly factor-like uncharacterized protein
MKSLFILYIVFTTSQFAQDNYGWEKIESPTNDFLRKIFFVDESSGWAIGLNGTIIATTDSGNSWAIQNSTVTSPIVDICFIDKNKGWALTYPEQPPFGTTILKTSNGGLNWAAESYFFEEEILSTIFFFDQFNGFIGGDGIRKTTNGGVTWDKSLIDSGAVSNLPVLDFSFYNKLFGYACGGRKDVAGVVWRTTNGGNNWSSIGISPDQIFDVFIFDSLNALALSGDPEGLFGIGLLKTTDAGLNWNYSELQLFGMSFAIDFINENNGWSASGNQFIYSTDKGATWAATTTPENTNIYDLQFVNDHTGFACGENGALLKYTCATGIEDKNKFVTEYSLEQNYPNPFNPSTKISWQSPISSWQTLKIFDVLGNELATLVDEYRAAGKYEVKFSPSETLHVKSLPSGIYFYKLEIGSFVKTKKMVILK